MGGSTFWECDNMVVRHCKPNITKVSILKRGDDDAGVARVGRCKLLCACEFFMIALLNFINANINPMLRYPDVHSSLLFKTAILYQESTLFWASSCTNIQLLWLQHNHGVDKRNVDSDC